MRLYETQTFSNMTKMQRLLRLAERQGLVRARDLDAHCIPRAYLQRLCQQGLLERVERGLYAFPQTNITEHHSLVQVMRRVPHGVIALLSALRFYNLTTQLPADVWLAIASSARKPSLTRHRLRVVRFSGAALTYGVAEHRVEGVVLRVTTEAKTVADCFKYRQKLGLDLALEAFNDYVQTGGSLADLWEAAIICRVTRTMQPYMEASGWRSKPLPT
jgi:predicted transcriptional regulator of viral defense system